MNNNKEKVAIILRWGYVGRAGKKKRRKMM